MFISFELDVQNTLCKYNKVKNKLYNKIIYIIIIVLRRKRFIIILMQYNKTKET